MIKQEEFKSRMDELAKDFDPESQDINQRWGDETQKLYERRGIGERIGFGENPCLLIVDMSIAFNDPAYKVGDEMSSTLDAISKLQEVAREKNILVAFAQIAYEKDMKDAGLWGKKVPALGELQLGTNAVKIHPRIAPLEGEPVIIKKYGSAFFMTNLTSLLVNEGIDTVILTGCSTSGCIRATAVDAISYGFRTIVPVEAVADRAEGPHWANLFDINAKYGDVISLSEALDYLMGLPHNVAERKAAAVARRS